MARKALRMAFDESRRLGVAWGKPQALLEPREYEAPLVDLLSLAVALRRLPEPHRVALVGFHADGGIPGACRALRSRGLRPPMGLWAFVWADRLVVEGFELLEPLLAAGD